MQTQRKSVFLLALAALIWGVAFVAQSVGMDYVEPFTFNAVRNFLGSLVLIPCILFFDRQKKSVEPMATDRKTLLIGGISCGIALAAGSSLQQIGIQYTTVGKAGFITALYIVLVPLLGIFLRKRVGLLVWMAVALAIGGMYLLCINESVGISKGDLFVLAGSLAFAIHILVIDHFSPLVDGVRMSCIQFFVCGLICLVPMSLFEHPTLSAILSAWVPIAYAGILSCGVAYTLQIIGQRNCSPTIASLILSLESVFSVLAGWLLLHQALTIREICGCILVFGAIILAQLPASLFSVQHKPESR